MPDGESLLLSYGAELTGMAPNRFAIVSVEGEVLEEIPVGEKLFGDTGVAVAADGKTALFAAQSPSQFTEATDLWELDLESGILRQVTHTEGLREDDPVFVDDHTAVVLAAVDDLEGPPSGWLELLDLRTGESDPLTFA